MFRISTETTSLLIEVTSSTKLGKPHVCFSLSKLTNAFLDRLLLGVGEGYGDLSATCTVYCISKCWKIFNYFTNSGFLHTLLLIS
jgi:hypothetical protein